MDIEANLSAKAETLRVAIHTKLRIKGRSFGGAVKRAGRLLPRRIRRQAEVITRAQSLGGHPKLIRTVSQNAVEAAYQDIRAYLNGIDASERRRTWWLKFAGMAAVNILIVAGCFIGWLLWAGYV